MNLFTKTLSKIFKSSNQQELEKIKHIVSSINGLEKEISLLKDNEFKERSHLLKLSLIHI